MCAFLFNIVRITRYRTLVPWIRTARSRIPSRPSGQASEPIPRRSPRHRWRTEQVGALLKLLLEARRSGPWDVDNEAHLKRALESILVSLKEQFPQLTTLSLVVLRNKFRKLRDTFRVLKDAMMPSDTYFDDETGTVKMSADQAAMLRGKHGSLAIIVLVMGIPLTPMVGYWEWHEIFSNNPPAGQHALPKTHKDQKFKKLRDEAVEARRAAREGTFDGALPTMEAVTQEPSNADLVLATPRPSGPSSQLNESSTGTDSTSFTPRFAENSSLDGSRGRRARGGGSAGSSEGGRTEASLYEAITALVRAQTEIIASLASRSSRVPGAEDLERAIRSCVEFASDREDVSDLELIQLMAADETNPVVWNALQDTSSRMLWIEGKLGITLNRSLGPM